MGPYHKFQIYEPKRRNIVSQDLPDKVVNHLVARHILMPALLPGLIDTNVASRKELGTAAGLSYYYRFNEVCKRKYGEYYLLKCDVKSYFQSIHHERLKKKILRRIKDKDALKIIFDLIDSEEEGLGIGNMTNQILAIFYLDDLDKFIKETLKIQCYVRYQDDFILWHPSKEYLYYLTFRSMNTGDLGVNNISVENTTDANNAILAIDKALNKVTEQRANLGASQNSIEYIINRLTVESENAQASESRIRDVDMAKEMVSFVKSQIIQDSSVSMLSQANQTSDDVLQLITQ